MKTTKADKWFSIYIRLRDSDENGIGKCCTCGVMKPIKQMDCGHFIKRQHMATRYSEMNCAIQCKRCNAFEQGRDLDFEKYLKNRYGEEDIEILKIMKKASFKTSQFLLDLIEKTYKERAQELSKEKGIELW